MNRNLIGYRERMVFRYVNSDGKTIRITCNENDWPSVMRDFVYFLRACGYSVSSEDLRDMDWDV